MVTLREDQAADWDFVLDGEGYMVEWRAEELIRRKPYDYLAPDLAMTSQDLVENLSDNKLDQLRWGTNRSWHEGADQRRLNQPDASSPHRFWTSRGVDIVGKGELRLLPAMSRVLVLENSDPAPQKLTATDTHVWVAAGQPNVSRFANLDASDVESISTVTETSQDAVDLASDGSLVYFALGPDGIHRFGALTETVVESFDSETGWTQSGDATSDTISSSKKKQGTGSYKLSQSDTVGSIGVSTKTFGSAQNYSAVSQFKIWVAGEETEEAGAFEYRLITSAGNYFRRQIPHPGGISGDWYEDTAVRTTDFTTVGAPNWANITQIEVRHEKSGTAHGNQSWWDSFRTLTAGSSAHWCDWDARVLGWAKDRLFAAGVASGTTWRFFEAAAGAASLLVYTLPDGWEVTDISELQGYVYFSAKRGRRSAIYAYDGTNAPFVAVQLPPGVVALSLIPFSGGGMLIGCRKVGTSSSAGTGILYRSFPTASGHLSRERIATLGSDDGLDYGIRTGLEHSEDVVHFGMGHTDAAASGLGMYLPETGGFTHGLAATVARSIADSISFKGRRIFTADGDGVWVEQETLVASGYVESSEIDLNVAVDKLWLALESTFAPLVAGQSITHAYSTDGGDTWLGAGTEDTVGSTRLRTTIDVHAPTIKVRTTLATTAAASPVLYSTGIGGWPSTKPHSVHQIVVRAFPEQQVHSGQETSDRDRAWRIFARLLALRDASTVVDFQPPWWRVDRETISVRVAAVQLEGDWGTTGAVQGGTVLVELREVA